MSDYELITSEIAEELEAGSFTVKQRSFIKCPKGSEAARRAGYSIKCAHQQAYENLRKPKIKEIIDRGLAAQTRAVCIKAGIIGLDVDLPEMFS
jgi:hypothetical protein